MKIAILTQPLQSNYGGLLQAYALQIVLKRMGHEVFTVDRRPAEETFNQKASVMLKRAILRWIVGRKDIVQVNPYWPTREDKQRICQHTDDFIKKNISTTEYIDSPEGMERLRKFGFDAYVVGSDQVWRPKYSPCLTDYFLGFLEPENKAKRVAYAASFGTDEWEFTKKQTTQCAELIKRFNVVSVREDSAVDLCKKHFGVDAVCLLDPAMLLTPKDYVRLVEQDDTSEGAGGLWVYLLDKAKWKNEVVRDVENYFGLISSSVAPVKLSSETTKKNIEDCIYLPVTAWIRAYINAQYVVTDSFHGTLFAILFNKPFISLANSARGVARFTSLLRLLHLEDRMISSREELTCEKIDRPIDFASANKVLEKEREKSIKYLIDSLQ